MYATTSMMTVLTAQLCLIHRPSDLQKSIPATHNYVTHTNTCFHVQWPYIKHKHRICLPIKHEHHDYSRETDTLWI